MVREGCYEGALPEAKVQRRSLGKGRKLRDGQRARTQKPNSIEVLVGIPNTVGEEVFLI